MTVAAVLAAAGGTGFAGRAAARRVKSPWLTDLLAKRRGGARPAADAPEDQVLVERQEHERMNPKLHALEELASIRDNWVSDYADAVVVDILHLDDGEIVSSVKTFLRQRSLRAVVSARAVSGDAGRASLKEMQALVDEVIGDLTESREDRVRTLIILMLDNNGLRRVKVLVERGSAKQRANEPPAAA